MLQAMESFVAVEEQFSYAEEAFYNKIRGLVVVFLFFVILLALAHVTLRYFVSRSDTVLDRSDRVVHRLVYGVCTFTLTITLVVYILLPFSIIANEVLLSFPTSVYVQWINTELVHDLSLLIHYGTKAICLIVPFAYFLLNSYGFYGRNCAFGSRLFEAVILTGLSYVLVFGTIWSFKSFISAFILVLFGNSQAVVHGNALESHPVSLLVNAIETLTWSEFVFSFLTQTFVQSLTSIQLAATFIGLLLLFIYMPIGLVNLTFHLVSVGFQSLPDLSRKSRVEEQLFRLQMEALCLQDDIETAFILSTKTPTWCESLALTLPLAQSVKAHEIYITDAVGLLDQLHSRLPDLQREIQQLQNRLADRFALRLKETFRPLIPIALLILITCMLRLMESFVFFNILDLVRKLLFGENSLTGLTFSFWNFEKRSKISATSEFTLGRKPVSVFGHVGAVLQVCIIQFLLCASLWGFHATPSTRFLRPRRQAVDLNRLLANVTLLLLFTSALPLQTNLLGLTSLTIPSALKLSSFYDTKYTISSPSKSNVPLTVAGSNVILCDRDSCQADSSKQVSKKAWSLWKTFTCQFSFGSIFSPDVCSSNDLKSVSDPQQSTFIEQDQSPTASPSIFAQFMARAFGNSPASSSLTPSPSYGSVFITLLYNLCFLATSVYVACLRLNDPILWLVSKVFTSLRYCPHVSLSAMQLHSNQAAGRRLSDYRPTLGPRNSSSR